MSNGDNVSFDPSGRRILLVGDIDSVFLDSADIPAEWLEVCADVLDGIDVATEESFAGVGVVMAGSVSMLGCALEALRDNCSGRIILLAQMHEEPTAIKLLESSSNGSSMAADDYLICPARFSDFLRCLSGPADSRTEPQKSAAAASPDDAWIQEPVSGDTSMQRKIELLEKLATEDDLTGLKNRRYLWEFSRQVIERAKTLDGRVTLLLFDIDDFKKYNDSYGHRAGDDVLRQASTLMRRCCRQSDVVGRIGGDEFAVLFWNDPKHERITDKRERRLSSAEHPVEAISVAKRLVSELENADLSTFGGLGPGGKGVLTISGGLASFPRDGSTIEQLLEKADKALLEAKHSGKNKIYLVGTPNGDISNI